jgi:hypothetical protein
MKYLLFILLALCTSAQASENVAAGKFAVLAYTWCNGPANGDAASCPSYSAWNGVELKRLKVLEIAFSEKNQWLKLEDTNGQIWQQDLATCNSKAHELEGCSHTITFKSPDRIEIRISAWVMNTSAQRLAINFQHDEQVTIFGPDNSHFMMTVKKQKP